MCSTMRRESSSAARFKTDARMRRDQRVDGDARRRRRRIEPARQRHRAREQRSRVAVLAHAEHDDVERMRHAGQRASGPVGSRFGRRRRILQSDEMRRGGRPDQQVSRARSARCSPRRSSRPNARPPASPTTFDQSSFSVRSCANSRDGVRPPETTRLAAPRAAIASSRSTLISPASACGQRLAVGKAVLVDPAGRHYSSFLQANPSRPIRELAAAGPQLPAV